ncbi:MAG: DUF86 domain-containing protein [Aquificaceae bacterium]
MPKKNRDVSKYLEDILDEIESIRHFVSDINSLEDFLEDKKTCYAVFKALENIGEAVKEIPDEVRDLYTFEWKKVAGLRDVLIHEYFGIEYEIIWDVIQNKLTELELAVKTLLRKLG